MTAAVAETTAEARLPALTGGWVSAYRLLCALLALAALGLMAAAFATQETHSAILALRGLKLVVVISVCAILLKRRASDPVAALLCLSFLTWAITSSFDFASTNIAPLLLDRVRFLLFALALLLFPWQAFLGKITPRKRVDVCGVK